MGSPRAFYWAKGKQNQEPKLRNGQSKSVSSYTEYITLSLGEATHKMKN